MVLNKEANMKYMIEDGYGCNKGEFASIEEVDKHIQNEYAHYYYVRMDTDELLQINELSLCKIGKDGSKKYI